jgi:hypothetical protein
MRLGLRSSFFVAFITRGYTDEIWICPFSILWKGLELYTIARGFGDTKMLEYKGNNCSSNKA